MFIQIIFLILLIFLNGVFAASEIAFLSVNKTKLKMDIKAGNKKAQKVQKLIDNPSRFLATIQIGITLAGFLASASAAEAFVSEIVSIIPDIGVSTSVLSTIFLIIVTIILSYFTLVFGELVPKRLAMRYPEKIAYRMVGMISVIMKITKSITTSYEVIYTNTKRDYSILKVFIHNGKTHQIRAVLSNISHPIIGDSKYGKNEINKKFNKYRQLLFAVKYKFNFDSSSKLSYLNNKDIILDKSYYSNYIGDNL